MVHELQSCTSKGATVQSRYRWSYKSIKTFFERIWIRHCLLSFKNGKTHFFKVLSKTRAVKIQKLVQFETMINSEKMEVELGNLKISLTSIGGMVCWSIFFNVSLQCNSASWYKATWPMGRRDSMISAFRVHPTSSGYGLYGIDSV